MPSCRTVSTSMWTDLLFWELSFFSAWGGWEFVGWLDVCFLSAFFWDLAGSDSGPLLRFLVIGGMIESVASPEYIKMSGSMLEPGWQSTIPAISGLYTYCIYFL